MHDKSRERALWTAAVLGMVLGVPACNCGGTTAGASGGDDAGSGSGGDTEGDETEPEPVSPVRLLRQLSFDLRGGPPSWAEVQQVVAAGRVPDRLIDDMLASNAFLEQVEQWHAEILWPNLERYQLKATSVSAFPADSSGTARPYLLGAAPHEGHVSPDPLLGNDEQARRDYVVAVADETYGGTRRGGWHAYNNMYCDMRPEAEYPDPEVVGTPANRYVVPAERSGTGQAFEGHYYSEDPETYGMVLPIQDYAHCPNYCRRTDCSMDVYEDRDNLGPRAGCFRDMDAPGDDPGGRHVFDTPGMRCADGYVREINACNLTVNVASRGGGIRGTRGWFPLRPRRVVAENHRVTAYNAQYEGWRWMEHYWSKGNKVKTCAYEAQEREFGVWAKTADGNPVPCKEEQMRDWYFTDPSCGCGPKGAYCQPSIAGYLNRNETFAEWRLRTAIEQEPLKIIRSVVERDEDYLSILTTPRSFVNGPLAFAYSQQSTVLGGEGFRGFTPPEESHAAWEGIAYDDKQWKEYTRSGRHSGILTTLEFLVRFPTYRARVAQYRRHFLCSAEFDYAPNPDPMDTNPDIAERNGCASCHKRLEEDGMWFARYPDRTAIWLDPSRYPVRSAACLFCFEHGGAGCRYGDDNPHVNGGTVNDPKMLEICYQHYAWFDGADATPEQVAYNGVILAGVFRDDETLKRMDAGPKTMVLEEMNANDRLQRCAARTAWRRLLRRRPKNDEAMGSVVGDFEAANRSYRALIRAIVETPDYRALVQPTDDASGGAEVDWDRIGRGRIPRRMSADQIRAAYEDLTGFVFEGRAVVRDPTSSYGWVQRDDADLLDVFAELLGRPDYAYTVAESLEPGVSFSKMVGDAARSTCGRIAQLEVVENAPPGGLPRLLLMAGPHHELPADETSIRANVVALIQRFWGRDLDLDSETVDSLVEVFRVASTESSELTTESGGERGLRTTGTVADGWRAVCIALASDPEFYLY